MNTLDLKRKIMNRVYILFLIRKLKSPVVFEVVIFALSSIALFYMVSIERIIANSPHDLDGLYHFWVGAFLGTKLVVKAILLTIIIISAIFIKKMTSYVYVGTRTRLLARA